MPPPGSAASSSVVAMPPAMFAPARLCTSAMPARSRMPAVIVAVVVLPLVAEMSTLPRGRRAPRSPIASGASRISSLPGALVPPPPRIREIAPTLRASASLAAEVPAISPPWRRRAKAPARTPRQRRTHVVSAL